MSIPSRMNHNPKRQRAINMQWLPSPPKSEKHERVTRSARSGFRGRGVGGEGAQRWYTARQNLRGFLHWLRPAPVPHRTHSFTIGNSVFEIRHSILLNSIPPHPQPRSPAGRRIGWQIARGEEGSQTTWSVASLLALCLLLFTASFAYAEDPVSLRNDVLPILSRLGCSSGACHGSPKGKGGFRLSLRAFDPSVDEQTLRAEFFSRRVSPLNPDASLLLRKPLMQVPHAGGQRMQTGTVEHQVLRRWIAEGAQLDPPDVVRCTGIQLQSSGDAKLSRDSATRQLNVVATYSDDSTRDVTHLVVFRSSDEAVATVSGSGLVQRSEDARGQTAITARYLEHIATQFLLAVPDDDNFRWPNTPEANDIDRLVHQRLKQLHFVPSPRCSDSEFIRRVYLDVTGLLPTPEVVQQFLADESANKRAVVIDQLLESPEHAKFMALKWGDALRIRSAAISTPGVFKYHRWVVRAFEQNMPYDEFAQQLLTASGSTFEVPAANFFRTADDTNDCTESTAQIFLGARLECAKCHNHPHERWTQDNYYGLGSFFNRLQRDTTDRRDELFVSVAMKGEVTQPRTGQKMKPWLPGVGEIDVPENTDRRTALADWLTNPNNPFFARVEVNRLWSQMTGRGIVEPIDDFRDTNPPSNAELLDMLAAEFVKSGFDRRHILRMILNSETWQRSSETVSGNETDDRYFSRYPRRLLSAEQLLDAICDVSGVPENFSKLPAGTRATQLPSPDFSQQFLKVFGQPARESVCDCERSEDLNLSQALTLSNGTYVQGKITNGKLSHASNAERRPIATRNRRQLLPRRVFTPANRTGASDVSGLRR